MATETIKPKVKACVSATGNYTYISNQKLVAFCIVNRSTTDSLTFTINGITIPLEPTEIFDAQFDSYQKIVIAATGSWDFVVKGW